MKIFKIIMSVLLVAACLAACKNADENQAADAAADAERVVITGEITETVGNMLTLSLMERREPMQLTEEQLEEMRSRMPQGGEGLEIRNDMTEEEIAAMRERFAQESSDGEGPVTRRGFPVGEGAPENAEGFIGNFPEGFEMTAGGFPEGFDGVPAFTAGRAYTGETREIIIPAGAPILEAASRGPDASETEISLDKLKAGDVIEVTYASDNETVAKVVKQSSAFGGVRIGDGASPGGVGGGPVTESIYYMAPVGGGDMVSGSMIITDAP